MDLITIMLLNGAFLLVVLFFLLVVIIAMPPRRRRLMIQPIRDDLRRIKEEIEEEVIEDSMPFKPLKKTVSRTSIQEAVD